MLTRLVVRNCHSPVVLFGALALLLVIAASAAYGDSPPPGHTGGFGEPTCHRCHADGPEQAEQVRIRVSGIPERYIPGAVYDVVVAVAHPDMRSGGFQMSSRFARAGAAGQQAGLLVPVDNSTATTEDTLGVRYAHHSVPLVDSVATWPLRWSAPLRGAPVAFHVAVNASNHDDSEFGDFTASVAVQSTPDTTWRVGGGNSF